jgi:hypothetical protein
MIHASKSLEPASLTSKFSPVIPRTHVARQKRVQAFSALTAYLGLVIICLVGVLLTRLCKRVVAQSHAYRSPTKRHPIHLLHH